MSWWCMYVVTRVHVSISMLYAVSYTWGGSVKSTLAGRSTSHSQLSPTHEHHACEALIISRTPSLLFLFFLLSPFRTHSISLPYISLSSLLPSMSVPVLATSTDHAHARCTHTWSSDKLQVEPNDDVNHRSRSRHRFTTVLPLSLSLTLQTFQSIFDCSPHSFGN